MARTPLLTIHVGIPGDVALGTVMGQIRTWLDNIKAQPASFRLLSDKELEITFRDEREAASFEKTFEQLLEIGKCL